MIEWTRARKYGVCGGCSRQYAPGDPIKRVVVGRRAFTRGECCAGAAPPTLPRDDAPERQLGLDWRRESAADREPGEEG